MLKKEKKYRESWVRLGGHAHYVRRAVLPLDLIYSTSDFLPEAEKSLKLFFSFFPRTHNLPCVPYSVLFSLFTGDGSSVLHDSGFKRIKKRPRP